jgi:urease accessory protein
MTSLQRESEAWQARLTLEVLRDQQRSRLGARQHVGPLRVQRPFYPEGEEVVHVYLLHPPGGLVGGDRLETQIRVREGASALVTTPAAQKLYRSAGKESSQRTLLQVDSGASLEWLPAETIVFDGALSQQRTRIDLALAAACIAWDIGCFGRPASELFFARGRFRQELEIWRVGEPLLIERSSLDGGSSLLRERFGYGGFTVYGSLYAAPYALDVAPALVKHLRAELCAVEGAEFAITALGSLVCVRALGISVELVRHVLVRAWQELRPIAIGRPPQVPRIWAT